MGRYHNGQDGHTYAFRARARDQAGNVSPYSAEPYPETTVDTTPPDADLYEIVEASPYAYAAGSIVFYGPGSGSFEVRVSASDATSGLDRAEFPATVSGGATYDQALGGAYQYAHAYAFTSSSTQEGGYQVQVYDQADNLATVPFTVTHDIVTPTVTMSLPVRSDVVTVTVEWFGDDGSGSGVATYDLEVSIDGGAWERLLTSTQSTNYQYPGQPSHAYTFRARGRDAVGNVGAWAEAEVSVAGVTKYYGFGGGRVAMRSEGQVTYLHADHLGSTSLLSDGDGDPVPGSRVSYYPYGQTRTGDLAALPTDFGFTGQRNDATIGLYDYHARWYDPALGRFISADTIVPEPASPQDLNRYAYVRNNPLKYIDPSGHDLMLVGGYNNNDWENPIEWKEWIMAYKGWTTEEWEDNFYDPWRKADDAGKQQLMADNYIYFFDWTACDDCMDKIRLFGDDPHQNASREADVKDMLGKLEAQLIGLKDITLIGHSKGGNLVINYMQRNGKYVKNAVIIDAVWKGWRLNIARAMGPIMHETAEHPLFEDTPANIVNIFNIHDPVNSSEEGWYVGDVVNLMVDESENAHSTKGWLAWHTLYKEFNVEFDHGSKHRGHGTRGR